MAFEITKCDGKVYVNGYPVLTAKGRRSITREQLREAVRRVVNGEAQQED